jgi:CDP-diacylglycerol--serine O-phosphatidyltransferase
MAPGTGSKYFVGLPCPAAAGLIAATIHAIKTPIEDWRWSIFWMLVVIADAALMSSTVRYRSFKDIPMLARQKSFIVIIMALLVWLIVAYSEVVLMVIAAGFVASGVTLYVIRVVRHYLLSHPAKT